MARFTKKVFHFQVKFSACADRALYRPALKQRFSAICNKNFIFLILSCVNSNYLLYFFMEAIIIRKRKITAKDLNFIQSVVHENWDKSRTQISKIPCTKWNWVQPNGQLKDMACREILLTLHRKGLLDYLPPWHACTNGIKKKSLKFTLIRLRSAVILQILSLSGSK